MSKMVINLMSCCCPSKNDTKEEEELRKKEAKLIEEVFSTLDKQTCKVIDIYVDVSEDKILHYKQCGTHGKTVPVNLKTALYKKQIFSPLQVSSDNPYPCVLDDKEVPGVEKNTAVRGTHSSPSIAEVNATSIRKFSLSEEIDDEYNNESLARISTVSEALQRLPELCKSSGDSASLISDDGSNAQQRPSCLLRSSDQRQRLSSKSVVIITPDESSS